MRGVADEVVVVDTPPRFFAIGDFYKDFAQTYCRSPSAMKPAP